MVLPLTLHALHAAGKHLIRWRALTFYYDFIPEEKKKAVHSDIQTAAAVIKLHLNHVDVPGTWAQYIVEITQQAAASSPSYDRNSSPGKEHSRRKESFTSFTRKLMRKLGSIPHSNSADTFESNQTKPSSNAIRNSQDPFASSQDSIRSTSVSYDLVSMFVMVAGALRVSRNQLELAFKYCAAHVSSDRRKRITAKDLVRDKRYSDLGEIILLDMGELAMFSRNFAWDMDLPHLPFHTVGNCFSDFDIPTAPIVVPGSYKVDGAVDGDEGISPAAPITLTSLDSTNSMRRSLLGKNHVHATGAIVSCIEHYFVYLRYEQRQRFSPKRLWSLLKRPGMDKKRKGRAVTRVTTARNYDEDGIELMQRHHDKHCRIVWKIRASSIVATSTREDLNGSRRLGKEHSGAEL